MKSDWIVSNVICFASEDSKIVVVNTILNRYYFETFHKLIIHWLWLSIFHFLLVNSIENVFVDVILLHLIRFDYFILLNCLKCFLGYLFSSFSSWIAKPHIPTAIKILKVNNIKIKTGWKFARAFLCNSHREIIPSDSCHFM